MTSLSDNLKQVIERIAAEIKTSQGGTGLLAGQIITSVIPIEKTGIIRCDGRTLRGDGEHAGFVALVSAMQTSNPELFLTAEQYQTRLDTFGGCERFSVGDDNGVTTLRIPCLFDTWHKLLFYMVVSV